jgi:hypothetical protein
LNCVTVGADYSRRSEISHVPKSYRVVVGSCYQNELVKNHSCDAVRMTFHLSYEQTRSDAVYLNVSVVASNENKSLCIALIGS